MSSAESPTGSTTSSPSGPTQGQKQPLRRPKQKPKETLEPNSQRATIQQNPAEMINQGLYKHNKLSRFCLLSYLLSAK